MADDIVEELLKFAGNDPDAWMVRDAADEIKRLRAEVERLRGWIDALAPRQSYEATLCPMCHAATEYKYWANVEQHKDGCPWREAARKEARRG